MKSRAFIISILVLIFVSPNFVSRTFAQVSPSARPRSERQPFMKRSYFPFRKKPTKEQKKQLLPREEDFMRYAQLLAQPNTGIFRLLPDVGCEANSLIVRADEACLNAIPESSFYSFREEEHSQEILADIRLKNGYLVSDGVLSQGILVSLGDVPLETVNLTSEGIDFLTDYAPHVSYKEMQKQFVQVMQGVQSGNFLYRKIHPAIENTTYALRVVAYKGNMIRSYRGFRYDVLQGDKRIDLTLAFRVIRKEPDGAVTLVWKELERRESPRIKFTKKKPFR
jgi:hypothetical protein